MRSILTFFLVFNIFFIQTVQALDFHKNINILSKSASVENIYHSQCFDNIESFESIKNNYTEVCRILREADVCKDVPKHEKVECEDYDEENQIDLLSFRALGTCALGLLTSLKDLFIFFKDAILGTFGYLGSDEKREEINGAIGEYFDSMTQYVALEYDKELDKGHGKVRASMNIAGNLIKTLFQKLSTSIQEEYFGLGCYSQTYRTRKICKIIGDVTLPPAAAIALIFKLKKVISPQITKAKESMLSLKLSKRERSIQDTPALSIEKELEPLDSKTIKDEATVQTIASMKKELKSSKRPGITSLELNNPKKLMVIRKGRKKIAFGNPRIISQGDEIVSVPAQCILLTDKVCNYNFSKSVTINYIDEKGNNITKKFEDDEAFSIQEQIQILNSSDLLKNNPDELFKKSGLNGGADLNKNSKSKILDFINSLTLREREKFKEIERGFSKDLDGINDPSSLLNSLKEFDKLATEDARLDELLKLTSIRLSDTPSKKKFKSISNWAKSPEHSLYLFDRLNEEGLNNNKELLRYLTNQNEYFKKAIPVRGSPNSFITFAFEKESKTPQITLYYKDALYTDEEWFNGPGEDTRIALLRAATPKLKDDVPYDQISPTAFRPNYLGKYTEETHTVTNSSYVWEIKSKKYEIDQERIIDQMRETSKLTGETGGFHTHIVFEMPKKYMFFDEFGVWSKQVNDYLYLKGMEEGLHGSVETNIMRFPKEKQKRRKESYDEEIPKSLESLERWSHKGFSMAIRGNIYGDSVTPNAKKVGLELRDLSRSIDAFDDHMGRISEAVSDYRWESIPASNIDRKKIGYLSPRAKDFKKFLKTLTKNRKIIKLLSEAEPYGSIPLTHYEKLSYPDYKTGKLITPSDTKRQQIIEARQAYTEEIKKTIESVEKMLEKGDSFEKEDLQMAIQLDLTGWAKRAQVSDLLSGIN